MIIIVKVLLILLYVNISISFNNKLNVILYNNIKSDYYRCNKGLCKQLFNNKNQISQTEDDGYSLSRGRRSLWNKLLRYIKPKKEPGSLILIRHGETTLNYNKTFTGWMDVDISDRGERETEHAARLLLERGFTVDTVYTSRLKRAIRSTWIILTEINQIFRPVFKSWRLNERMYGALEGDSKIESALIMGEDVVQDFRNGLEGRPPPMLPDHPHWHANERKYADLDPKHIPTTESLKDTMDRTIPLWESRILPDLREGKTVLIVAHANSLRGIVKHVDNLNKDEISKVAIPNGIPLVYKFDRNMKPIKLSGCEPPISGEFLEKKGLLRAALQRESERSQKIPGYESAKSNIPSYDAVIRGLTKLSIEREFYPEGKNDSNSLIQFKIPSNGVNLIPQQSVSNYISQSITPNDTFSNSDNTNRLPTIDGPVVVIIRHGKTEYNKLGIFTGWDDAPLAAEGIEEATKAGRILKQHGIEFDVVYTSWLSRAIVTAWLILRELDSLWLPIMKSWRLNERMYGALTGLSKKMIAETYGEAMFRKWRRGYAERPPPITSFSSSYPGNDERYVKYVKDIRFSIFESLIRSISHGRIELHRKFPKTESLKDCMSRTIPYFKNVIYPQSIAKGKNVLIASSENAIRGLLMHLCEIPPYRIHEVEIPTGLPLVYDVKRKCIHLLDDGEGDEDMLSKYNFGTSPELLFRPCIDIKGNSKSKANIKEKFNNVNATLDNPVIKLPFENDSKNYTTSKELININ